MTLRVVQLPSHFTPTHETAGLPGFPAIDCFAPSHSPVASPCAGRVVKTSGHPPTPNAAPGGPYGYSIYLACAAGTYYLTHFGQKAENFWHIGARIKRGQYLGKIADYSGATHGVTPSHIHEGFHAGPWSP